MTGAGTDCFRGRLHLDSLRDTAAAHNTLESCAPDLGWVVARAPASEVLPAAANALRGHLKTLLLSKVSISGVANDDSEGEGGSYTTLWDLFGDRHALWWISSGLCAWSWPSWGSSLGKSVGKNGEAEAEDGNRCLHSDRLRVAEGYLVGTRNECQGRG